MALLPLLLVVVAAFTHATWNLLAKRAAHAGAVFVAAYTAFAVAFYAPLAVWAALTYGFPFSPFTIGCVVLSGFLHLVYSLVLQRGYQVADLSVIYPIARGTGPLLSAIGAFTLLGEAVTQNALLGLASVVAGILILATGGRLVMLTDPAARSGVLWGGATGTTIAAYTIVDAWGVIRLGISPILFDWIANLVRLAFLIPSLVANRTEVRERMQGHWGIAALVGLLSPLGYILVLTALQRGAPLHAVAPAREMSMMIGALLGMLILGERMTFARLGGCALIVIGVVLLAD